MSKEKESKRMGFPMAIFTLIVMVAIMAVGLAVLKLTTVTVFALVLVAMAIIAMCIGFSMNEVQEIILDGCKKAILVILILMSVGMVVGSWIAVSYTHLDVYKRQTLHPLISTPIPK